MTHLLALIAVGLLSLVIGVLVILHRGKLAKTNRESLKRFFPDVLASRPASASTSHLFAGIGIMAIFLGVAILLSSLLSILGVLHLK